jgi:hypothetical protein
VELYEGDQGHHEADGVNGGGPGDDKYCIAFDTEQQHLLYLGGVGSKNIRAEQKV